MCVHLSINLTSFSGVSGIGPNDNTHIAIVTIVVRGYRLTLCNK